VGGQDAKIAEKYWMNRSVRWLMMGIVLAGLGWYVWHARQELTIITKFNLRYLPPMLLVPLLSLWANGWIAKELTGEFGVRLGGLEAYALSTVNALGNYLPVPQAGAVARGVYLKRVHDLSYSTYAASLVATYVTSLALYGVVGLSGLTALAASGQRAPWQLWLIFAALSASLVLFAPLSARVPLPRRLAAFRAGLLTLGRHHVLTKIVVLQLVLIALTATGLWLACLALPGGEGVNWFAGLMMGLLIMASGVANVTPGNLGVEQAAAMLAAHLLKIRPEVAFLASSLFRVMAVMVVIVIGPLLAHWLARQPPRPRKGFEAISKSDDLNSEHAPVSEPAQDASLRSA
jgi:hypothetical protein